MSRVAVFPGSFDPMTMAHLDVGRRAAALFDRLVIGVLHNPKKAPLFTVEERVAMIREAVAEFGDNVVVEAFDGLTVEFARRQEAGFIVRGLRAVSDFEAELQMAHTNRRLRPAVDTIFLMSALEFGYLSSTLAKEVAQFGGDVGEMVPPPVRSALEARFRVALTSRGHRHDSRMTGAALGRGYNRAVQEGVPRTSSFSWSGSRPSWRPARSCRSRTTSCSTRPRCWS